jgi:hypothetical protein
MATSKTSSKSATAVAKTSVTNLASVVDEIFGDSRTDFTLKSGKLVTFQPAKLRQLGSIVEFLRLLLDRISPDALTSLLQAIANEQEKALEQGKSHNDVRMEAVNLITKALGHNSLILGVLASTIEYLPPLISSFCDMTTEEVDNIDLDDMTVVVMGILSVNYSFFTQSLPPIVRSAFQGWQAKNKQSGISMDALQESVARITRKRK